MLTMFVVVRNPLDKLEFFQGYGFHSSVGFKPVQKWGIDLAYIFTDRTIAESSAYEVNGIVVPFSLDFGR